MEPEPNKQAERLLPMVAELLPNPSEVKAYAATLGPGSFTGIRIGLSALIGMQAVHPAPFYGASTMELAAFSAGMMKQPCTVILNAMRGQVFVQHFTDGITEAGEISLLNLDALTKPAHPVISNCPELLPFAATACPGPDAANLIGLLQLRAAEGRLAERQALPIYVRPPDAKLPQKKPL